MNTDQIIDLLDTLTAADLRRVLARAQELNQLYSTWQDPSYTPPREPGSYVQEYVRCGKPGCKACNEGKGHGPYWQLYTSENGRTKKRYIGKQLPAEHMPGANTQRLVENMPGANTQRLVENMPGANTQRLVENMPGANTQRLVENMPGANTQRLVENMPGANTQRPVKQTPPQRGPSRSRKQ